MNLDDARTFYNHDDETPLKCDVDGCDGVYVKYEYDKMCNECGHLEDQITESDRVLLSERRWHSFEKERTNQSGFYGHDRIRFVGGVPQSPLAYTDD